MLIKKCVEILGDSHGVRISNLIHDVVATSLGKNEILMSNEISYATNNLRDFMFKTVYIDSQAKTEDEKAQREVFMLFETFMKKPE